MKLKFYFLYLIIFLSILTIHSQDFWQQTNGPYTEDVTSLLAAPNGYVFCGSRTAGVYRTSNNGDEWTNISRNFGIIYIRAMAANAEGNLFVGDYYGQIYRSTDNGDNWTNINNGVNVSDIRAISISSNGDIFIAVHDGSGKIYRSMDNGNSWIQTITGLSVLNFRCLTINLNRHIFVGTDSSIFRSIDNGNNWTEINNGLPTPTHSIIVRSLAASPNGDMFAGLNTDGIYKSTNNGNNWFEVNQGLTDYSIEAIVTNSNGYIFTGTSLEGIFRSIDNGNNWIQINNGLAVTSDINAIAFSTNGNIFAGTGGGGIYYSTNNGDNWEQKNQGLNRTAVSEIAVNSNNEIFTSASGTGIFRSTNNGDYWIPCNLGLPNNAFVSCFVNNSKAQMFAGTYYEGVFRLSEDYAWINTNLSERVFSLVINSLDHIFAGGVNGVFLSTDNGGIWTSVGLTNINIVYSLATSPSDYIFAGTDSGAFFSTNNGINWIRTNVYEEVYCFAFGQNNKIFAGTKSGIFCSTDYGISWEKIFTDIIVTSFTINQLGHLYAGTYGEGIYRSINNGENWEEINQGFNSSWVSSLAVKSDGYIFAGATVWEPLIAGWLGVYRSVQSTNPVDENLVISPNSFELYQNYPNPFNPKTNIRFRISDLCFISLKVYDLLGKEVAILVDEERPAGKYEVKFDASDLSSGTYFYKLSVINQDQEFNSTKKLIFLK